MKLKLFIASIAVLLSLVAYKQYRDFAVIKSVTSYESCASAKGSIIQESYPATCITRLGSRFNQYIVIPWEEAEKYILAGEVKLIDIDNHNIVSLLLKSGAWIHSFASEKNALSDVRYRCGDKCRDMLERSD